MKTTMTSSIDNVGIGITAVPVAAVCTNKFGGGRCDELTIDCDSEDEFFSLVDKQDLSVQKAFVAGGHIFAGFRNGRCVCKIFLHMC